MRKIILMALFAFAIALPATAQGLCDMQSRGSPSPKK